MFETQKVRRYDKFRKEWTFKPHLSHFKASLKMFIHHVRCKAYIKDMNEQPTFRIRRSIRLSCLIEE